jgi:hypothetical protein
MKNKNRESKDGYMELISIIIGYTVLPIFILMPIILIFVFGIQEDPTHENLKGLTSVLLPMWLCWVTYCLMGFQVHRSIKLDDLSRLIWGEPLKVYKTYYYEKVKKRQFPFLLLIFSSSLLFLIGEFMWFTVLEYKVTGLVFLICTVVFYGGMYYILKKYAKQNKA